MNDKLNDKTKVSWVASGLSSGVFAAIEASRKASELAQSPVFKIMQGTAVMKGALSAAEMIPVFKHFPGSVHFVPKPNPLYSGSFLGVQTQSSAVLGAMKAAENWRKIFPEPQFAGFNNSFLVATAAHLRPHFTVPEEVTFFEEVSSVFEDSSLVNIDTDAQSYKALEARVVSLQRDLLVMISSGAKKQSYRFYIMLLIALLGQVLAFYRAQNPATLAEIAEVKTMVATMKYDAELENTAELVSSTVARNFMRTRIFTKLYTSPIRNSGVVHHLSEEQEVLVIAKQKKYYYVSLIDCHTGELWSGFLLKKHCVN